MSDIIKINEKPVKTVTYFEGQIELDEVYQFIVAKTSNGTVNYLVTSIGDSNGVMVEEDRRYSMIYSAVIKYAEKNGIGS